jgi:hypothetical protein
VREVEVHLEIYQNGNGRPLTRSRFKRPLLQSFDRLLIQSMPERASDHNIMGVTVHAHDCPQNYRSLNLRLARFL